MSPEQAVDIVRDALTVAMMISMPILVVGLVIGLVISIFQAVTQIQEQTLTFVPKIIGMGIVTVLVVPWVYAKMAEFAMRMFTMGS